MPLRSIPAREAFASLRSNGHALWPDPRRDGRRLDGIVMPDLSPGFRMRANETVFTVGSCFARDIERQLAECGFRLPALRVELPEDERASDTGNDLLNKYNPHSIVNELVWAFEETFPRDAYLKLDDDLWHDPHLAGNVRPAPLARVKERRKIVRTFYRSLPRCRTVIVTLGLIEAWFDEQTGLYLNQAPPPQLLRSAPDRFRVDILSAEEVAAALERLHALIRTHGHPEAKLLVTVSPVPLKATYTGQDVLVANSHSKSVLRAAVGEFAASHDRVDYFPSYEAVTLTPRSVAFLDDNRHVAPELVDTIMAHVIGRYTRRREDRPADAPDQPDATIAAAIRNHLKLGRHAQAADLLAMLEADARYEAAGYDEFQFRYQYGKALADADRVLEAEIQLARCVEIEPASGIAHYALGRVLSRLHRSLRAEDAFASAARLDPSRIETWVRLGRVQARSGKLAEAEQSARAALRIDPAYPSAQNLLAEIGIAAAEGWAPDDSDGFVAPRRAAVPGGPWLLWLRRFLGMR